ncbi:hypothetical protein M404DRAFT_25718 [Pisolithus tinctorius Marx 270]|uniref:Uncharacterized protein n=1 Tax=Pisolithus tinctorius Marx 270 TaxID=870435 RepID=A0A0C3J7S2_PISTI|nr:hypothetical protein M404DRAFT_25718 [Pisolithus tinctorius Marx 270]
MSNSRLIITADNNNEGQVVVNLAQVPDDDIRYNTNDKEEVMRAKAKERKRRKVAEQAWWEEKAQLEAERAEREKAEAKRAAREAEEERAHKEEEKHRAEEEREAKQKHKAKADKGDEARGEVRKVVMDPSCTCCARAQTVCEFIIDSNKKRIACMQCNLSKGKCCWPRDGKDTEAGPKAVGKVGKGKKRKADEETPEPGLSQKKQVKSRPTEVLEIDKPEAGGSGVTKARAGGLSGLEDKLKQLIDVTGLIANNLVGLFKLQEAVVKNSGRIADALEAIIDESFGFGVAVTPSDLGSSKLDLDELHEEAAWLQAEAKGEEEEEAEGGDDPMAEAE